MDFEGKYFAGFFAGENGYEFRDDESDEWKRGYEDGDAVRVWACVFSRGYEDDGQ